VVRRGSTVGKGPEPADVTAATTAGVSRADIAAAAPGPEVARLPQRLTYQPAIDGIRALAVLGVLADHTGYAPVHHGGFGVDVFFVLSGFLITTLLLEEHAATGRIALRLFWWRRAARLLPALVAMCPIVAVAYALYRPLHWQRTLLGIIPSLLYVSAWVRALRISDVGWMGHTWSLSVEEWFYAAWPLLVVLILRFRNRWLRLIFAAAALATAYRLVSEQAGFSRDWLYNAPDQRACQLLIGCALGGFLVVKGAKLAGRARALAIAGWAGAAFLTLLFVNLIGQDNVYLFSFFSGETTLLALAAAALIAAVVLVSASRLARTLSYGPLVWIGRRSYGIYLWHYPLMGLASPAHGYVGITLFASRIAACSATIAVASVSYRWLERPVILAVRAREKALRSRAGEAPPRPRG
jgi:peptidoglycan/LPS O-acetylase OafA/YrhL